MCSRPSAAHPSLVDHDLCGDAAHPTTKRSRHGAPQVSNEISFTTSWSSANGSGVPQPGENDPERILPAAWLIQRMQYKPGGRFTLTVRMVRRRRCKLTVYA